MNNVSLQKDFMRSHIWAVFTLEVFYEHKDSFMWNQTVRPLNSLRTVSEFLGQLQRYGSHASTPKFPDCVYL